MLRKKTDCNVHYKYQSAENFIMCELSISFGGFRVFGIAAGAKKIKASCFCWYFFCDAFERALALSLQRRSADCRARAFS